MTTRQGKIDVVHSPKSTQALLLALGLLMAACNEKQPIQLSAGTLCGAYKGIYANGMTEVFVFRPEGTFTQSLTQSNRVLYTNEGQWEISKKRVDSIGLRNVFLAVDVWNLYGGKPAKVKYFHADWNSRWPGIVFSDEEGYWVKKTSGDSAKANR